MEKQDIKKQVGQHFLTIEQGHGSYVVRLSNGKAIAFPPSKKGLNIVLADVENGKFDEYIKYLFS